MAWASVRNAIAESGSSMSPACVPCESDQDALAAQSAALPRPRTLLAIYMCYCSLSSDRLDYPQILLASGRCSKDSALFRAKWARSGLMQSI